MKAFFILIVGFFIAGGCSNLPAQEDFINSLMWNPSLEIKKLAFMEYGDTGGYYGKNKVKTVVTTDYDSLIFEIEKYNEDILLTEKTTYFAEGSMNKSKNDTVVERYFYKYDKDKRLISVKMKSSYRNYEKKYYYEGSSENITKFDLYVKSVYMSTTYFYYNKQNKIDSVVFQPADNAQNNSIRRCYLFYNEKGRLDSLINWRGDAIKIDYDKDKFTFDDDGLIFEYYFKDNRMSKWIAYSDTRKIVETDMHYLSNGLTAYGKSNFFSKKNRDRPLVRAFKYTYY